MNMEASTNLVVQINMPPETVSGILFLLGFAFVGIVSAWIFYRITEEK